MKIQYFVFNYGHFEDAVILYNSFSQLGDTYLLNCASHKDPPFEANEKIKQFDNIYYAGQWNESLKLLTADVLFITNADVRIPNIPQLVKKMNCFYNKYGDGLYAPNHHWTPWTYNPALLKNLGNGLKKVPATDSTIWSISSSIAHKVGPIDLTINKLGWGIELICAYYCNLQNKLVVRDYSIKCLHPQHSAYDRVKADHDWKRMIDKMNIGQDFWHYYESRKQFGFGWHGDDNPAQFYPQVKIL